MALTYQSGEDTQLGDHVTYGRDASTRTQTVLSRVRSKL